MSTASSRAPRNLPGPFGHIKPPTRPSVRLKELLPAGAIWVERNRGSSGALEIKSKRLPPLRAGSLP